MPSLKSLVRRLRCNPLTREQAEALRAKATEKHWQNEINDVKRELTRVLSAKVEMENHYRERIQTLEDLRTTQVSQLEEKKNEELCHESRTISEVRRWSNCC